jgi:hypothetical protein
LGVKDRVGARPRHGRTRLSPTALAAGLLLVACATAPVIDAPDALNGRELDTALGLYGQYDDRIVVSGKNYYVWRKTIEVGGQHLGCELRAEVAYRTVIRETLLEGFAGACAQFSVRYTAMPETREEDEAEGKAPALRTATCCKGCRPVGSPTTTARRQD